MLAGLFSGNVVGDGLIDFVHQLIDRILHLVNGEKAGILADLFIKHINSSLNLCHQQLVGVGFSGLLLQGFLPLQWQHYNNF